MIKGTLIAESFRVGAELGGVCLTTRVIRRLAAGDLSASQPEIWTLIEFEAEEAEADALASALARVLDEPGWYADFRSPGETFVVYPGQIFRYPRGDSAGRAEAAAHGRTLGVPEHQLDWPRKVIKGQPRGRVRCGDPVAEQAGCYLLGKH